MEQTKMLKAIAAKGAGTILAGYLLALSVCSVSSEWSDLDIHFQMALVTLGGLATAGALFFKNKSRWHWIDTLVMAWWSYVTFNYWFLSSYPAGTAYTQIVTTVLLYAAVRLLNIAQKQQGKLFIMLTALAGGYEAVLGFLQLYGIEESRHAVYIVTGTFFNPGPYSAYLVTMLAICSAYLYRRYPIYHTPYPIRLTDGKRALGKGVYALCALAALTMLMVLPATWSRAAFVSYAVVLAVLCHQRHRKIVWIGSAIALASGIVFYFLKQDSANGRILMWMASILAIKENWLTGAGIGGFAQAFAQGQASFFSKHPHSPFINVAGTPQYAFNEFLYIGTEQGLIGLLFFLGIIVASLYTLFRRKDELAYGWLALLVFALFSYPFALLPFRILGVWFVARAASSIGFREKDKQKRFSMPHLFLGLPVVATALGMLPTLTRKVETTFAFKQTQSTHTGFFIEDYWKWQDILADNSQYLFTFAKTLNQLGRYNDSNAMLKQGTRVSCDPMFYVVMGNNYKKLNSPHEAEKAYLKAFHILPNRLYPLYQLMILYNECERKEDACAMARKIIKFTPKVSSQATEDMKKQAREILRKTKTNRYD